MEKKPNHKWQEVNIGGIARRWKCCKCELFKKKLLDKIEYTMYGEVTPFKQCSH